MLIASKALHRLLGRNFRFTQCRYKSKKKLLHEETQRKKATEKALEHFDDFYKKVFGAKWPSIRVALLSPNKYCAVVNNYGDAEETITNLQNRGAINLRTILEIEKQRLVLNESKVPETENIYKLDQKIERLALSKQQDELGELYPPTEEGAKHLTQSNSEREGGQKSMSPPKWDPTALQSLEAIKENAEIDESRMIDASVGLSSGALFEFVPATKLQGMNEYVLESQHYSYYSTDSDFPVSVKQEFDLNYPEHLNAFFYERGSVMTFEQPRAGSTGVLNYYNMDGGSLLPVLALGVEPGDTVLDMCAGPGGKSLAILQTLHPDCLVCNDVSGSRLQRVNSVLRQYLYDLPKWKDRLTLTKGDGRGINDQNKYDKVLVDVPCTTDRHSLHDGDNSFFHVKRLKERLKLPELQSDLLKNALMLVAPGGTVVYATCSLSPIQNDGVVHMALRKIWEESKIEVEVRDLSPALEVFKSMFRFEEEIGLKYGHLVLPFLPCNFGPLYFCKIVRIK